MRFALLPCMAKKRTSSAPLALALDGSVLLNANAQLEASLVSQVAKALSVAPSDVFIGTRLAPTQRAQTLIRIDDAAAEAAARIHGLRAKSSSPGRSRRTYKKL